MMVWYGKMVLKRKIREVDKMDGNIMERGEIDG